MRVHRIVCCTLAVFAGQFSIGVPAGWANYYQFQIDRWVMQDSLNPPADNGIVFVGSSSFVFWETLTRDFSHYNAIQRGFGGSQFSDLNLFVDDIVLPYDPAAVVVFEGGNDVNSGKTAQRVLDDYLDFVDLVHTGQDQTRPAIPIFFLGITPTRTRWSQWDTASEANALIEALTATNDALHYIDAPSIFLATSPAPGQPPVADLFTDGLHLSSDGYAIWTDAISAALEAAVLPTRTYELNSLHPRRGSRILVDFGPNNPEDGDHTASPDDNGNHWNNWHPIRGSAQFGDRSAMMGGESLGNLVTIEGHETGIDIILTAAFSPAGKQGGGLLDPNSALLGEFAVASGTHDYFWAGTSQYFDGIKTGGFMLTGLDPSLAYDLRFFGTRESTDSGSTDYRILSAGELVSVSLQTSGENIGNDGQYDGNDNETAIAQGIRTDEFGQIFIDVDGVGNHRTYLGIMEITVVPEPASIVLLIGLAALGILARRGRCVV
jgi:lysophospholipase L1-like esterase